MNTATRSSLLDKTEEARRQYETCLLGIKTLEQRQEKRARNEAELTQRLQSAEKVHRRLEAEYEKREAEQAEDENRVKNDEMIAPVPWLIIVSSVRPVLCSRRSKRICMKMPIEPSITMVV